MMMIEKGTTTSEQSICKLINHNLYCLELRTGYSKSKENLRLIQVNNKTGLLMISQL